MLLQSVWEYFCIAENRWKKDAGRHFYVLYSVLSESTADEFAIASCNTGSSWMQRMSNVRFDELELMLMAMFEQPTLKDTIQVLTEIQPLVAEDAEMSALVQQTIPKMQRLTEPQFKGLELEWHRPEDDAGK